MYLSPPFPHLFFPSIFLLEARICPLHFSNVGIFIKFSNARKQPIFISQERKWFSPVQFFQKFDRIPTASHKPTRFLAQLPLQINRTQTTVRCVGNLLFGELSWAMLEESNKVSTFNQEKQIFIACLLRSLDEDIRGYNKN